MLGSYILSVSVNADWGNHYEKTIWSFLRRYLPKRIEIRISDIGTPMFTAALLTIAEMWRQPKWPFTDEWIKKMWYVHTMEIYSAFKKKESLQQATTG